MFLINMYISFSELICENSYIYILKDKAHIMKDNFKTIYLAGGCFWGTEHYIRQFEGVVETTAGYANGKVPNPSYEQVYTDETGYVECVKVTYDPEIISLVTLVRLFFKSINPLLKNRQGNDYGTRYRTGIYWSAPEDMGDIIILHDELQARFAVPIYVEKCPLECFYPAEEYHQDYLLKNPDGYCHLSLQTLKNARIYARIIKDLRDCSDDEKKMILPRFFKTGKGEYGEGDRFIGVSVPEIRKIAGKFKDSPFSVIESLLESEWHECRMCGLLILVAAYPDNPQETVDFYLKHTSGINNWDLVDLSAPYILGRHLVGQADHSVLYSLAESTNLWEQRIAVVSTLMLIRHNDYSETISLAEKFIEVRHDLMRKAVGWMLREVGKRDEKLLVDFLEKYRRRMPRTMLRYSIEKFPPQMRKYFMS